MANLVIPNEGKIEWMKRALYGNAGSENLTLKLFSNNVTPGETDTAATYTEATFTGYAAATLTSSQSGATWAVPTIATNIAQSAYGTATTWTATTDQTIYGWFIVGASSGKCYAAQAFGAGKPLAGATSDQLTVTPVLQLTHI
jgi:hypothetical protein